MLAEGEQAAGSTVQEAVDNMVMGDESLYEMRIREMMKTTGMSRGEAERTALTQDVRALGSTTPLVSGLGLHGGSWGLRRLFGSGSMQNGRRNAGAQANPYILPSGMSEQEIVAELWARGIIKDLPEKEVKSNQPYTDNDMKIIKWLYGYEDAFGDPPFTDQGNGGIMELNNFNGTGYGAANKASGNLDSSDFILKGTKYSAEYTQKLYNTHRVLKDHGYNATEHAINRIMGRVSQGKISSVDEVVDVLKTGTKYQDTVNGGTVLFINRIAIHCTNDGVVKTVTGNAKVKSTWEEMD